MKNGFSIIQSNDLEVLAETAFGWCEREPLQPLEEEIFLVQSNGMADWLRLQQASREDGISASIRFPMPASFLWQVYRQVLTPEELARSSPFDKDSLQWRIWRLLPALLEQSEFTRPRQFLLEPDAAEGGREPSLNPDRRMQFSQVMADLYDQYQLYRAPWLQAWEAGRTAVLGGGSPAFRADEAWQAGLWRAIVADMPAGLQGQSRARLHTRFLQQLGSGDPGTLPRRVFLFGINALPAQLLQALYAMAPYTQLLLMVLSPCREFWEHAGAAQADQPLSNPLLDGWGARGRDFMRLLHGLEPDPQLGAWTQDIDAFVPRVAGEDASSPEIGSLPLPLAMQQQMLDNAPPPRPDERLPLPAHAGLEFLPAWGRRREVEVLHDRLLALFAADPELRYRDVVVMAPDIERYVPHVNAVFGRHAIGDPRRLSWSISDRPQLADSALYQCISWLLELPQARVTQSELLSLLEQSALRQRFGMADDDPELLRQWARQSWTRWGLDAGHKASVLDMDGISPPPAQLALNNWQAGLDQLLAGYCLGGGSAWDGAVLDEATGSSAVLLGQFHQLLACLKKYAVELARPRPPEQWAHAFSALLEDLFLAREDADRNTLLLLQTALGAWLDDCQRAAFADPLPLGQAREAWLAKLQQPGTSQHLAFSGITFCTLMPMRALPFAHILILGMNDGDYPREQLPPDFDLMQHDYQPGDRDRRGDDHYLLLEALLSVRQGLHISWLAHDMHKNQPLPPSVLVQQLRDYVDRHWQGSDSVPASALLTRPSPLASFSRSYFEAGADNPRTYSGEWFGLHAPAATATSRPPPCALPQRLASRDLARLLEQAAGVFYEQRLGIRFPRESDPVEDDEPFEADGLTRWMLRDALLRAAGDVDETTRVRRQFASNGSLGGSPLTERILDIESKTAARIQARLQGLLDGWQRLPDRLCELPLELDGEGCTIWTRLPGLHEAGDRGLCSIRASASRLRDKDSKWRLDKLYASWLDHLLANASGLQLETLLLGLDTQLRFAACPAEQARQELLALLRLYKQALQQPLPVSSGAALSLLANRSREDPKPEAAAAEAGFTSDSYQARDDAHPAVARAFPDFSELWNGDGRQFSELAEALYLPLLVAINQPAAGEEA